MSVQKQQNGEAEYPNTFDPTKYDRPSVMVDVAMLSVEDRELRVLVVQRNDEPEKGYWGLPGGFVGMEESLERAADRVLNEKTGLSGLYLEQLYTFGDPSRDERNRVISVVYYALVDWSRIENMDTEENSIIAKVNVPWEGETGGPVDLFGQGGKLEVAFDHEEIIGMAVKRIRGKLDYVPIGFQLLPSRFTLRQLQEVHETILDRPLNKDSFRRRMLASGLLEATGEREEEVGHRPGELYRFVRRSAI